MRQECVVLQLCEARFLCSSVAVLRFSAARASVITLRRQVERSLQLARDSQVLGFRLQGLCETRPWGSIRNASSVPFNRALAMTAALHTVAAIFRHPGDMAGHLNLAFVGRCKRWDAIPVYYLRVRNFEKSAEEAQIAAIERHVCCRKSGSRRRKGEW